MGNTVILSTHRRMLCYAMQLPLVSVMLLLNSLPASAQTVGDALAQCATISDSAERLACFDRVAAGGEPNDTERIGTTDRAPDPVVSKPDSSNGAIEVAGAKVAEVVSAVPDSPADSASADSANSTVTLSTTASSVVPESPAIERLPKDSDNKPDVPANPTPAAAPAKRIASRQSAAALGLGQRTEGNIAVVPPEPNELSASVERIAQQPRGEHIVFLDNDQVWVEEFKNSYFPIEIGDAVTIKKRKFGGFRLVTESGKTYRVKRLR